jgi:ribosome-binding factor A
MRFHRPDRVSKVIREELSKIILREMEFGGALVTVTSVDIDKKLSERRERERSSGSEEEDVLAIL